MDTIQETKAQEDALLSCRHVGGAAPHTPPRNPLQPSVANNGSPMALSSDGGSPMALSDDADL